MALDESFVSGSRIDYQAPCTSSEGRLCDMFADLPVWNEYFWQAHLELQELSQGQLSLVDTFDGRIGYHRYHIPQQVHEEAAILLRHLLTHHRCLVSVDLTSHILESNSEDMCAALRQSASLKKLAFRWRYFANSLSLRFAAAISQMNQLEVLDCSDVIFDHTSSEGLSNFLASTRSLTTLYMTRHHIEQEDAALIIQGLKQNATITTLSLTESLITRTPECSEMFSDYLRCNRSLRILSVMSYYVSPYNSLRPIIGALYHNDTLSELNLIRCRLGRKDFEVITGMLKEKRTLRSFHMIKCSVYEYDFRRGRMKGAFSSESGLISLWLATLAANKTLEQLTLDLHWIDPGDCGAFFEALASNTSLQKVTIDTFNNEDVAHICRTLRDTRAPERFFVGKHHLLEDTIVVLPECKELSHIRLRHCSFSELEPLHTALCVLPTCSQVNSLCLQMKAEMFNANISVVAQYITNTTALRKLHLKISKPQSGVDNSQCDWNAPDRPERTLLQALSLNKSIRRLSLKGICISEAEAQILVDTLETSRTLCYLSFYPERYCRKSAIALILKLSPNVASNYTLLGMHTMWSTKRCEELFTIADVVRRNNSLVTRAADFLMGMRHKYCAAAAELMQFNPGLVEKVQELASVDEIEAASRIERSLKSFYELDDFMRLAGVVKCNVTCNRREDNQKQLVDLKRDCWLHIRQHLKVGDILDPK